MSSGAAEREIDFIDTDTKTATEQTLGYLSLLEDAPSSVESMSPQDYYNLLNQTLEVGKLYYQETGKLPTLENFDLVHHRDSFFISQPMFVLVAAWGEEESRQEVEQQLQDRIMSLVEAEAKEKTELLRHIRSSGVPPELFRKKQPKTARKGTSRRRYELTDEMEEKDDEVIFRYHRYRFAQSVLGIPEDDHSRRSLLRAVLGFDVSTGIATSSFYGVLETLVGSLEPIEGEAKEPRLKRADFVRLANTNEWVDLLYPDIQLKLRKRIATLANPNYKDGQARPQRDYIAEGVEFYRAMGRLPNSRDMRHGSKLGYKLPAAPSVLKHYGSMSKYHEAVIKQSKRVESLVGAEVVRIAST